MDKKKNRVNVLTAFTVFNAYLTARYAIYITQDTVASLRTLFCFFFLLYGHEPCIILIK